MIDSDYDVNAALLAAAEGGDVERCIELLHSWGATVDARNGLGESSLHLASLSGRLEVCRVLIAMEALVDAVNEGGETPLHEASTLGKWEVCEALLEAGASCQAVTKTGETPLHRASLCNHLKVCRLLITAKASVNAKTESGATPLHYASRNGCAEVCQMLLDAQASVCAVDQFQATPLHWASRHGHVKVCRVLIAAKAPVDAVTQMAETPLHWASRHGCLEVCRLLIAAKAPVDAINQDGETPLECAASAGNDDLSSLLLEAKGLCLSADKSQLLSLEMEKGLKKSSKQLASVYHKSPDAFEKGGRTELDLAIQKGDENKAIILLTDEAYWSSDGGTPLHLAAERGLANICRYLVNHGARLDVRDNTGFTPSDLAHKYGYLELAQLLKEPQMPQKALTDWTAAKQSGSPLIEIGVSQSSSDNTSQMESEKSLTQEGSPVLDVDVQQPSSNGSLNINKRSASQPSLPFLEVQTQPSSPDVLQVSEKEMPYTSVHLQSSKIGEDGGRLQAGGVTALYPPAVLPIGTNIEMIVAELADNYKIDGQFAISPQVTMTMDSTPGVPLELTLPLKISQGDIVSVRLSETSCTEPLSWKELPQSEYSVRGDNIVIKTTHSTIYQALSGPDGLDKIEIVGNHVYFTLQEKPLGERKSLCLRLSDKKGKRATLREEYNPVVPVEEVVIRNPPGLHLEVQLRAIKDEFMQLTSPHTSSILHTPLDETFYIQITNSSESTSSFRRKLTSLLSSAKFLQDWLWVVELCSPALKSGFGQLTIHPGQLTDSNDFKKAGKRVELHFTLNWTRVDSEDHPESPTTKNKTTGDNTGSAVIMYKATTELSGDAAPHLDRLTTAEQPSAEVSLMESGTATARKIPEEVPIEAITELSVKIGSQTECVRLAAKLGFKEQDIIKWDRSKESVDTIAREVFLQWRTGSKAAKRSVLEKSLMDIDREDLAVFFNKLCIESSEGKAD